MQFGLLMGTGLMALTLSTPGALAGPAYAPVVLAPPETVEPPPAMLQAAAALRAAAESQDWDALAAGIAETVTWTDGALEAGVERSVETLGPWESADAKLDALAYATGGDVRQPMEPDDTTPYEKLATADNVLSSLQDDYLSWGRDPLHPDAICTYPWRAYDRVAVERTAELLDVFSSAFFYIEADAPAFAEPVAGADVAATLLPDRLYALDYDAEAKGAWIGVHLPEGGSGFIDLDALEILKPYAAGICFGEVDGDWQLVGQTSTSL